MHSLQRQREIYLNGLAGRKPPMPMSYPALEEKAKHLLRPEAFAYLAGGAGSELTIRANRMALEEVKIHPHMLGGVQEVSMFLKWRAHDLPAPFLLAPIGVLELAHHDGDLAVARAARETGVPMIISSQASYPMEEIAKNLGESPRLFQLYYSKSRELSKSFIRRAEQIDCRAVVVTLDTTLLGWRTRDLDLGYSPFLFGKGIAQYTSDPVFNELPDPPLEKSAKVPFTLSLMTNLLKINNTIPGSLLQNLVKGSAMKAVRKFTHIFNNPGIQWDDVQRIREWTSLPIYLKGILRADDAWRAKEAGVNGIMISNHGGRQIDGEVSSTEAFFQIKSALDAKDSKHGMELWLDSGIRSGSDIFKALALGATGVLIGRPYAMALACNGSKGIVDCLHNLMSELELTMALSGCKSVDGISSQLITHPWKTT